MADVIEIACICGRIVMLPYPNAAHFDPVNDKSRSVTVQHGARCGSCFRDVEFTLKISDAPLTDRA